MCLKEMYMAKMENIPEQTQFPISRIAERHPTFFNSALLYEVITHLVRSGQHLCLLYPCNLCHTIFITSSKMKQHIRH